MVSLKYRRSVQMFEGVSRTPFCGKNDSYASPGTCFFLGGYRYLLFEDAGFQTEPVRTAEINSGTDTPGQNADAGCPRSAGDHIRKTQSATVHRQRLLPEIRLFGSVYAW